jgi:NAD(P)-dependent dehydrogenase (short-subunit alcohol dehydrogenase family)
MCLRGQTAVVTGASSGIGHAISVALAAEGAELCAVGRSRERLAGALAGLPMQNLHLFEADLSDEASASAVARQMADELSRVDILVHCAAAVALGPVETAAVGDFDLQYRLNLRAPFMLTQAMLPLLKKSRGQVVFINSTAGARANANASQYSATKHGLRALADSLREEVNRHGIRVVSVFPGRTETPMQRSILEIEGRPFSAEGLMGAEDVARVVVDALLASRRAELTEIFMRPARAYPV